MLLSRKRGKVIWLTVTSLNSKLHSEQADRENWYINFVYSCSVYIRYFLFQYTGYLIVPVPDRPRIIFRGLASTTDLINSNKRDGRAYFELRGITNNRTVRKPHLFYICPCSDSSANVLLPETRIRDRKADLSLNPQRIRRFRVRLGISCSLSKRPKASRNNMLLTFSFRIN